MELSLDNEELNNINKKKKDHIKLEKLRKVIESMDKSHHLEIAQIFKNNNVSLTENNNGIFLKLNDLSEDVILKIEKYINFVNNQEIFINNDEKLKQNLEDKYFKDKDINNNQGTCLD